MPSKLQYIFLLAVIAFSCIKTTSGTVICDCAGLSAITCGSTSANYVLGGDIDCTGYSFTPICPSSNPFSGTLNGENFVIRNLQINSSLNAVAIFQYAKNASFSNLWFENIQVTGSDSTGYLGTLVGSASDCTASSVHISGSIIHSSSKTNLVCVVGGLFGYWSIASGTNTSSLSEIGAATTSITCSLGKACGALLGTYSIYFGSTDTISLFYVKDTVSIVSTSAYTGGFLALAESQGSIKFVNGYTQVSISDSSSGGSSTLGGIVSFAPDPAISFESTYVNLTIGTDNVPSSQAGIYVGAYGSSIEFVNDNFYVNTSSLATVNFLLSDSVTGSPSVSTDLQSDVSGNFDSSWNGTSLKIESYTAPINSTCVKPIGTFTFASGTNCSDTNITSMFSESTCYNFSACFPTGGYSECSFTSSCTVLGGAAVVKVFVSDPTTTSLYLAGTSSATLVGSLICKNNTECGFATQPSSTNGGLACDKYFCSSSYFVQNCTATASTTNYPAAGDPFLFYYSVNSLPSDFGCQDTSQCCSYVSC